MSQRENTKSDTVDVGSTVPASTNLQRFLSVRSVLSTASSNAAKQQEAADAAEEPPLEEIGFGFCGVVFNIRGAGKVVKRAMGVKAHQLNNDYQQHLRAYESHKEKVSSVAVPVPGAFIEAEDCTAWQSDQGAFFAETKYREPACLLVSERIPPLPQVIRNSLVDDFCPEQEKPEAKTARQNKSCLVRLYLGVKRPGLITTDEFTLRNFQLTLDRMLYLGLDTSAFAQAMAESLATLHWVANIDAFDVEYVLGSAPTHTEEAGLNFLRRTVHVWLLDFNQCGSITVDEAGVDLCTTAFWGNDPYYPRPSPEPASMEAELWATFSAGYLAKSHSILGDQSPYPRMFIANIEKEAKRRATTGPPPKAGPPPKGSPMKDTDKQKKKARSYA